MNHVTGTDSLTFSPCDPYTICVGWEIQSGSVWLSGFTTGTIVVQATLLFPTAADFAEVAFTEFYTYASLDVAHQQAIVNFETSGRVDMAADPAGQIEGTEWSVSVLVCKDTLTSTTPSAITSNFSVYGKQPYTYYEILYEDFCVTAIDDQWIDLAACTGEASQLWAFVQGANVVVAGAMYNKLMSMCWYDTFYPCDTTDSRAQDYNVGLTSSGTLVFGYLDSFNLQPRSEQQLGDSHSLQPLEHSRADLPLFLLATAHCLVTGCKVTAVLATHTAISALLTPTMTTTRRWCGSSPNS